MHPLADRVLLRLRDERGMALAMALGISMVLSIGAASVVLYSTSNEKSASRSKATTEAYNLAEDGMSRALAVLQNAPASVITTQAALPGPLESQAYSETRSGGRVVSWYGVHQPTGGPGGRWKVVGIGQVPSTSSPGDVVVRRVRTFVPVNPAKEQPLLVEAWKYIYSKSTGSPTGCDMTVYNNTNINSSIYTEGNLCLQTPSSILGPKTPSSPQVKLYVKGYLNLAVNTDVGKLNALTDVGIVGGCRLTGVPLPPNSCGVPLVTVKPKANEGVSAVPSLTPPVASFSSWWEWSKPGPNASCVQSTGTTPVFDQEAGGAPLAHNNSIPAVVDLTPPTSYSCIVDDENKLIWDASSKKLTIAGTIFIDGSVTSSASVADYDGNGAIYVSGTFLLKNASLCGDVKAGKCDATTWTDDTDPDILVIAAAERGEGGSRPQDQVAANDSIEIKSSHFQGGLYGVYNVEVDTSSGMQGPIISESVIISQTGGSPYPIFVDVPFGTPGNPITNFELSETSFNEQECGTASQPC